MSKDLKEPNSDRFFMIAFVILSALLMLVMAVFMEPRHVIGISLSQYERMQIEDGNLDPCESMTKLEWCRENKIYEYTQQPKNDNSYDKDYSTIYKSDNDGYSKHD